MAFSIETGNLTKLASECLVVPIVSAAKCTGIAADINPLTDGLIAKVLKQGDISNEMGCCLLLPIPAGKHQRVLLVGAGSGKGLSTHDFTKLVTACFSQLHKSGASKVLFALDQLTVDARDQHWMLEQIVQLAAHTAYKFDDFKLKSANAKPALKHIHCYLGASKASTAYQTTLKHAQRCAEAVQYARYLGDLPANICTPTFLAKECKKLVKASTKASCKVLEKKDLQQLKMGSFLSVTQGSPQPPKLIVLKYNGGKAKQAPVVLVGKGVTFDTGGNSLKPAAFMEGMKYDMCGAASVIGALQFAIASKLPINVVGLIAATENTAGGAASRPDDVVTSMSGLSIEILNTDAEGRLILCDTLTYAARFKPACVVDMATLTGACVVALGRHHCALYSNDDKLRDELNLAGQLSHDPCWPMPMGPGYHEQLKSNFADIANIGGPEAGSITAACFLARFCEDYTWAHLDVAGTAFRSKGGEKGATGKPVPLLAKFLQQRAGK